MSSGNGPGRLPSLKNTGAAKPGLKFKPKAAARRSKEEREASAPKLEPEQASRGNHDKKKPMNKRATGPNNQNRRMARFLNNTHVVSTGPLAAGNFVGDRGGGPKRTFAKLESGSGISPLVLQGLKNIGGNDDEEEEEEEDNGEADDEEKKSSVQNKFNMGKEYSIHDLTGSDDEEQESSPDIDEETWRALRTEELFPIRPVRYRHQDLEVLQNINKEAVSSDTTTREPTPAGLPVKEEPTENSNELQDTLKQKDTELRKKLDELSLAQKFQSLDQNECMAEIRSMHEDHDRIWKKLNKNNDKPGKFVLFQLPPKLPALEHNVIKPEPAADADADAEQPTEAKENETEKKPTNDKDTDAAEPLQPLTGRIGSIRLHKSGRLTAKIGNVVMDISRGTETTFLQDAVTINQEGDAPPFAELLGRVDGRVVVTPRL